MDSTESRKRGRPKKSFEQLSLVSKRRKVSKIRSELSTQELVLAVEKSFKADGFLDASKLVSIISESPELATDFMQSYKKQLVTKKYTADEALALMIDIGLSARQYIVMYEGSKKKNCSLYPPYHQVAAAKNNCYPPKDSIKISDIGFSVDLQSILDLTAKRLIQTLTLPSSQQNAKLRLISKWGFDGASSQSQYKQKFVDYGSVESGTVETGTFEPGDDSSIFLTSLVPIVLHLENQPENVYWQNVKTSSTTLCRPLRLAFKRETEKYTIQIKNEIDEEISNLQPSIVEFEGGCLEIHHELICSMIDGKTCNHLMGNRSTQTCFICGATPTKMNNIDVVSERPKCTEYFKYGLSTLHAWINFLECVLKISYNMPFKKWTTKDPAHKILRKERKEQIQKEFRQKTGLLIDYVKQGKGTTNDGNTARRFFGHYELSAEITGFNVVLLKRFAVILQAISSRRVINVENFANYVDETARLYVDLYPWYYMPVTVHKILLHGSDVIQRVMVPIGQLSEEVLESRHKEVRKFRLHNTRKISRLKTNEDLLHCLLISSDPLVSTYRQIPSSKKKELFDETNQLLLESNTFN